MKHNAVATGNTKVKMEDVESVIRHTETTKDRANMLKAGGKKEMQDWEDMFYLGMKYAMEKLGLIQAEEVEF